MADTQAGEGSGPALVVALSGGGYRAAMFSAGAMLAVADSNVVLKSVSSVSGGSIASAGLAGALAHGDAQRIEERIRALDGLVRSSRIGTQALLKQYLWFLLLPVVLLLTNMILGTGGLGGFALTGLVIALIVVLGVSIALIDSWYAVQSEVEHLVSQSMSGDSVIRDPTMEQIGSADDGVVRVFCATDLSTGDHVYLSTQGTLMADDDTLEGTPRIYVADAVAASACFPGFRPLEFDRAELGPGEGAGGRPNTRQFWVRLFPGLLGVAGLGTALAVLIARTVGLWADTEWGEWATLGLVVLGLVVAAIGGALLRSSAEFALVDGGICDNLGPAFSLLSQDDRYLQLAGCAGWDGAARLLVVDAGKPFKRAEKLSLLAALIPLRFRAVPRSVVQLIGNANGTARKRMINRLLTGEGGESRGAVVSLTDEPAEGNDRLDETWKSIVDKTTKTPTTLDMLTWWQTAHLVLQGYRVTRERLGALTGVELQEARTTENIIYGLIPPSALDLVIATPGEIGAMAERLVRLRPVFNMFGAVAASLFAVFEALVGKLALRTPSLQNKLAQVPTDGAGSRVPVTLRWRERGPYGRLKKVTDVVSLIWVVALIVISAYGVFRLLGF